MKKDTLKMIPDIVFFAALWGITEATLGYVIHWIPGPLIAGSLLFPFAALILVQAYKRLDSIPALMAIGALAALIKSVNLLMPNLHSFKVINPMIAIMFETAVVTAFALMFVSKKLPVQISAFIGASLVWRGLFLAWQGYQYLTSGFLAFQLSSTSNALEFTLLEGMISALIAIGVYYGFEALKKQTQFKLIIRPYATVFMFAVALVLTPLLKLI